MSIIVKTTRITIREFLPQDLETYLNHFTDEKVALYIPKRSRDERVTIFNNALLRYQETKAHGIWGMFINTNNDFVGSCLLRPYNDEPDVLELGYSIGQKYWGQGIATEMAIAVSAYGFANEAVNSIVACTELPNIASQRVLEKTGFIRTDNVVKECEEVAFFKLHKNRG